MSFSTIAPETQYYNASFDKVYPTKQVGGKGWSKYLVHIPGSDTRESIDRRVTSAKFRSIFGPHASESGWALPKKHPRHLLNLPIEILHRVLSYILVAPQDVTPITISCNYIHQIQEPSYYLHDTLRKPSGIVQTLGQVGTISYRGWYRKPIDATVLRVAKILYQEGIHLLYGENVFLFDLHEYTSAIEHRFKTMTKEQKVIRRIEGFRNWHNFEKSHSIQENIRTMYDTQSEELPDCIYLDPFARFLHTIGGEKALFLRKLRLQGRICDLRCVDVLDLNINHYLQFYTPFIIQYCPNIENLGIGISDFSHLDLPNQGPPDPEDQDEQIGDHLIAQEFGQEVLKAIRASREKNHLQKRSKVVLDHENQLGVRLLKPLIDKLVPGMRSLQTLQVKRCPPKIWHDFPYLRYDEQHKISEPDWVLFGSAISNWYGEGRDEEGSLIKPYIDMDIADEAKLMVSIAVKKRSDEMEAKKTMAANTRTDDIERNLSEFVSQLDLGDDVLFPREEHFPLDCTNGKLESEVFDIEESEQPSRTHGYKRISRDSKLKGGRLPQDDGGRNRGAKHQDRGGVRQNLAANNSTPASEGVPSTTNLLNISDEGIKVAEASDRGGTRKSRRRRGRGDKRGGVA